MQMNNLNTQNPNQLEYTNKLIKIAVLGGIRLDGLDRMRVTVKIQGTEVDSLAVRHNLDLYNDTQVEKLIRKTATKLEIGTSVIEASINELIEALEKYRLEQLENTNQKVITKQLTEKEKSEALQLLQSENLLTITNTLIGQSGIIGEETNRLIMYLIFSSRKREQPLHIISLGSSGTGKTHLQESIGNLIPDEEKTEITTLSENAFYYFGPIAQACRQTLAQAFACAQIVEQTKQVRKKENRAIARFSYGYNTAIFLPDGSDMSTTIAQICNPMARI
jgi:hypothetical protein